jgi:hypothetical protein
MRRREETVLLVHSDPATRRELAGLLASWTGARVVAVGAIAHVKRWPADEIVVVEGRFFTPFWVSVGAAHVIVLERAERPTSDAPSVRRVSPDVGWHALYEVLESLPATAGTAKVARRLPVGT